MAEGMMRIGGGPRRRDREWKCQGPFCGDRSQWSSSPRGPACPNCHTAMVPVKDGK